MKMMNSKQIFFLTVAVITIHIGESATTAVTQRTIVCPGKNSSTTWVHPSEIAKECLDKSIGKSLVTKCQNTAENAWDPSKTNSSISTVWETCCSLYQELDCYLNDGQAICPAAIFKKLQDYTKKVVEFFQASLCHTVIDLRWRDYCDAKLRNSSRKHPVPPVDPSNSKHLVDLPPHNGPEDMCFKQMANVNGSNLVNKCMNDTLNIWDPYRNKTINADMQDGCCAFNSVMNCLVFEAKKTCSKTNLPALLDYQSTSLKKMSTILCKNVPIIVNGNKFCNKIHSDPHLKGGSLAASVPSIVALFFIFLGFSIFVPSVSV